MHMHKWADIHIMSNIEKSNKPSINILNQMFTFTILRIISATYPIILFNCGPRPSSSWQLIPVRPGGHTQRPWSQCPMLKQSRLQISLTTENSAFSTTSPLAVFTLLAGLVTIAKWQLVINALTCESIMKSVLSLTWNREHV